MTDRQVKVSLIIDDHGSVKVMRQAGEEGQKTEGKLEHLDKGVKKLGSSFGGLKTMIGAGLGALGIGGLAFGIKDVVSNMEEMATKIEKFHATTGIGAQQSLDYTAALEARGVGAEAGANAFKFLAKNIQSAERQYHSFGVSSMTAAEKGKVMTGLLGVQAGAFKELGINIGAFAKLSEQGKFEAVTKAFENMGDGAKKTRLAVQVFGRGGTALLPVLDKGALGLSHFTAEARKFFPTIKGGQQGLEEWKVKQGESKLATEGLEFTLGMKLVPTLIEVEGWFSKTILEIEKGHGSWGTLERDGEDVADTLKDVWVWFEKSAGGVHTLIGVMEILAPFWAAEKIINYTKALKGLEVVQGISKLLGYGGLATSAEEAGVGVSLGLTAMLPEIAAVGLAVAGIYEAAKHAEEIREFLGLGGSYDVTETSKGHFRPGVPHLNAAQRNSVTIGTIEEKIAKHEQSKITSAELQTLKVDLHLDTIKAAEAIIRNPRANRLIAEGTAHHASKMAARGGASR